MRITVEIDSKTLKALLAVTGEAKKSPAISKAVKEFLRLRRMKVFANKIVNDQFDYPSTNSQVESLEYRERK